MPDALDVALEAAADAGRLLLEGHGRRHAAEAKGSSIDLVTEYDRRSEAIVVEKLRRAFPSDEILAEESGLTGARGRVRWLVDPLDGTTNFAHGLPLFCVSIAREVEGVVDVGVVAAPALGTTYHARRGEGAFLDGKRLAVSDIQDLGKALVVTGFPYDRHTSPDNNFEQFIAFQRRAQGVRRLGAAALDLCLVGRGAFDGYWEMKLKPWDVAAGALVVEEAGGRVTDWKGRAMSVDKGVVVASNARIHDAMLATLATTQLPSVAR